MQGYIPVIFCFDAHYAPYAAVATHSALSQSASTLRIYWVTTRADLARATAMRDIVQKTGASITIVDVDEKRFSEWKETHHISRAAYLKLLLPELIPEDRAIYLDCDTITLGDLRELYEMPLGSCRVAGAVDAPGAENSKVPRKEGDIYINSGVMLLDLAALRSENFLARCEQIYLQHRDGIAWLDQCIINKYAEGNKAQLDARWNRQVFSNFVKPSDWQNLLAAGDTRVIHFLGDVKPWMEWCNPCIAEFWWKVAGALNIPDLKPLEVRNINQAVKWAEVMDLNENYKAASAEKSHIIKALLTELNNRK